MRETRRIGFSFDLSSDQRRGNHIAAVLVKDLTDLGHTELVRRAFNQSDAQPVLKVRQPGAQLGFRLARRPFCRRNPAVPNDLAKVRGR
jgi:hypothetical protein